MSNLVKGLIALSCIAFVLAVLESLLGIRFLASAEAYSRACSNLALIAIALAVGFKSENDEQAD